MYNIQSKIVTVFFSLIAFVYIGKLFQLQVVEDKYKTIGEDRVKRDEVIYPYRGIFYDRNGKLLVYNTPVYDLMVIDKEAEISDTTEFCDLLGIDTTYFITWREDFIKKTKTERNYQHSRKKPYPFIKQISHQDFAAIQDRFDYKGFLFVPRTVRAYPEPILANTLGYIAEISPREKKKDTMDYYADGDYIGKIGLEKNYERKLRGQKGMISVEVDRWGIEQGRWMDGEMDISAISGMNLTSTIDAELQQYGELLMKGKVGSIVAIEPSTGEILSLVTAPTYNPNELAGKNFSLNYGRLSQDSTKPLFDRATQATYPPGSIFKLVQALIGQQMGVITPYTRIPCNRNIVACHGPHTILDLHGSIKNSCNPYYYGVLRKILNQGKSSNTFEDTEIGYDAWRKHVLSFGLGQRLGTDLSHEKGGQIPKNSFYDRYYGDKRWKVSTIQSIGIGQGELLVVPIQMANVAAIIANKGWYYTPHAVKAIDGNAGDSLLIPYRQKHHTTVDAKHFPVVIDAMEDVLKPGGTAYWYAYHPDIAICGKTGTAQNPHGKDHSVFIAFAPKENPKIAIAVYVENSGFGGTWAAPIASLMIEKYLTDSIAPFRERIETHVLSNSYQK